MTNCRNSQYNRCWNNYYPKMLLICICVFSTAVFPSFASTIPSFEAWQAELRTEALSKGISPDVFDTAFAGLQPIKRVIELDRSQPEFTMTLDTYLSKVVSNTRVKNARQKLTEHKKVLDEVSKKFGVQSRFIVALWGIETNFGQHTGGFPVIAALATLAHDGRRSSYFRGELLNALQIIEEGHISSENMKGSWAGAMGQSQFMPMSFLNYAVDYDGDGKKDIWHTPADVFASIANYLAKEGWDDAGTWGRQVKLTKPISQFGLSKSKMHTLHAWQDMGVRRFDGRALPTVEINASLIMPDGEEGRIYLVYNNFHTLMKWNRSSYFGVAVGYLSERIKRGY